MRHLPLHRCAVACLLALTIAGCGWHPRGAQELPPQMRELRLASAEPEAALAMKLRRALEVAGVELAPEAGRGLTLQLGEEQKVSRKVALDANARSAEQEMRVSVEFALRDAAGALVFGPRMVAAARIYAFDPNSIIAKQDEENLIYQELQDNLVGQIFRQLRRAHAGPRT